ncbi:MAG TPA: DUF192 domain-containing protein [Candidatus Baltobacteraceae bacterium]|nr:DUF192 domain-containing protein [Candidatus Baltobacteraceae bacterium]
MRKLVAALAVALALAPASARATEPATTACSNPRLPPAVLAGSTAFQKKPSLPVVRVRMPALALNLAVAANENDRELGLMCVLKLAPRSGMIFVFERANEQGFWMKNTLLSLDMIWVEADGRVSSVAARVPASTLETTDAKVARRTGHGRYVIELAAGEAAADGIVSGAQLQLPPLRAAD